MKRNIGTQPERKNKNFPDRVKETEDETMTISKKEYKDLLTAKILIEKIENVVKLGYRDEGLGAFVKHLFLERG